MNICREVEAKTMVGQQPIGKGRIVERAAYGEIETICQLQIDRQVSPVVSAIAMILLLARLLAKMSDSEEQLQKSLQRFSDVLCSYGHDCWSETQSKH
jgi:hypothetical protein